MWGDPEKASRLESSDILAGLLLQVAGPAHIPWNDPRWQELLHGYDVWVHLEPSVDVAAAALASMTRHASTSSNLAALCLHVARMIHDLHQATIAPPSGDIDETNGVHGGMNGISGGAMDFTQKIALVGKARATAGALNLCRLFVHDVMARYSHEPDETLLEIFFYQSRDISERHHADRSAGFELMHSLMAFLSSLQRRDDEECSFPPWNLVPELYDATVLSLELVLVLLSTQLYQPMVSSSQRQQNRGSQTETAGWGGNTLLDYLMQEAKHTQVHQRQRERELQLFDSTLEPRNGGANSLGNSYLPPEVTVAPAWTPQALLNTLLSWQMRRPRSPERSVAFHFAELAQSVVQAKGEKIGSDGMYETHLVVLAARPEPKNATSDVGGDAVSYYRQSNPLLAKPPSRVIMEATRGVLVLSSSLILLPFRLMSLALGLWGHGKQGHDYDQTRKSHMQAKSRRTNDIMWLTDSPVTDLGNSLLLLLTHNYCATVESNREVGNPFRAELAALNDSRWEAGITNDPLAGPDNQEYGESYDSFVNDNESKPLLIGAEATAVPSRQLLSTNFESLFQSFGNILHTESGALLLYTALQASPRFAAFLSVRSDLDTLVLPILRTLYFSSSSRHYSPHGLKRETSNQSLSSQATAASSMLSIRSCPFRSQSQLYVILILLLIFSQDASFGKDAFRRVVVPVISWYKERNLKDVSLGSLVLLTLLRSMTFNLNKLHDAFLLSNCCAVLMNLSPHVVNLHDYAAMRLASVTASCMKRYSMLIAKNEGSIESEEDITSVLGLYGEVSRTLLRLLRHCVGPKNLERNVHLVYALVYHETDFKSVIAKKPCPFPKSETARLDLVITTASRLVQEHGEARTAPRAMVVLEDSMGRLQELVNESEKKHKETREDFTFSYEEEADPELFFLPYVWEVIVCTITASTMDWDTNHIQAFALLDEIEIEEGSAGPPSGFSQDVSDVV